MARLEADSCAPLAQSCTALNRSGRPLPPAAMCSGVSGISGVRQMAHHLIQPVLGAALHAGELRPATPRRHAPRCGDRLAGEALARSGYGGLDVQEFLSPVGGLHHEGTAHRLPVDGHVLVPCQQKVKVQLLAQAVGHVLVGGRQHAAGGQISLEAAVINAQRQHRPGPAGIPAPHARRG